MFLNKVFKSHSLNLLNRRNVYNYPTRMKMLESWKINDELSKNIFKNGKYLIFNNNYLPLLENVYNTPQPTNSNTPKSKYTSKWLDFDGKYKINFYKFYKIKVFQKLGINKLHNLVSPQQSIEELSYLCGIDSDGTPLLALNLPPLEPNQNEKLCHTFNSIFLKNELAVILCKTHKPVYVGYARTLLKWHHRNMFCGSCGNRTVRSVAGNKRVCESCKETHYPQASPVIICVVTDEERKKCLVVRGPHYPKGMYSAIAGFVETGEAVEETIRREVAEEVGLEIETISFVKTQHWPLGIPALMMGFLVTAKPGQVVEKSDEEIEDYKWFTRQEVIAGLEISSNNLNLRLKREEQLYNTSLWLPPKPAIANHLFQQWLQTYKS